MADVRDFEDGGYRYIKAVFQYSGGVAALPGFEIERARLARPLPLEEGFSLIEQHLASVGRPVKAFAACELRSPAPFTEQAFRDFNIQYSRTLERWGLWRDVDNPVARTNVCPMYDPPAVPSSPEAARRRKAARAIARPSCVRATPRWRACARRFATS